MRGHNGVLQLPADSVTLNEAAKEVQFLTFPEVSLSKCVRSMKRNTFQFGQTVTMHSK